MTKKLYLKQEVLSEINSYNNELCIRRKKLLKLRKKGIAFPNNFRRNAISEELYKKYSKKNNQELKKLHVEINIAGRMIHRRILGKASFVVLQDMGGKIQVYITCNVLPKNIYEKCFKHWDLGDILGVSGTLFKTKTGELSVFCKTIQLLTKSLRPLPDKFHGLNNQETRYRQRYLDLISNYKIKEIFKIRSLIISEIRRFMLDRNFMEVETPMIQMIPGGASARPFITKHNTLNLDMYLRISPELYLKKLVVGGFERIFEINRNFRNEGISSNHSPEFTMIEIYMAYSDYKDLIDLIQQLLYNVAIKVFNTSIIHYGNYSFDLEKPFDQMTMQESINYYLPEIKFKNIYDSETIISIAKSFGIKVDDQWRLEMIHMAIFEEVIERRIINPTCITSYPIEVSPLARRNDDNPFFADRFEIFIAGKEIGNGFSELNDPEDQLERFLNQKKHKNIQDNNGCNELSKDFITYDKDYITALEHGLPPTAGVGIGIDRLIMLFTNMKNIRDVILFPILRESEKK